MTDECPCDDIPTHYNHEEDDNNINNNDNDDDREAELLPLKIDHERLKNWSQGQPLNCQSIDDAPDQTFDVQNSDVQGYATQDDHIQGNEIQRWYQNREEDIMAMNEKPSNDETIDTNAQIPMEKLTIVQTKPEIATILNYDGIFATPSPTPTVSPKATLMAAQEAVDDDAITNTANDILSSSSSSRNPPQIISVSDNTPVIMDARHITSSSSSSSQSTNSLPAWSTTPSSSLQAPLPASTAPIASSFSVPLHQLTPSLIGVETFYGYIESVEDAILVTEACRRGLLPRVPRRLGERERLAIRPGSVFVFGERESGIRRWTDGKLWSPSRITGEFLAYRQLEAKTVPTSPVPILAKTPLILPNATGTMMAQSPMGGLNGGGGGQGEMETTGLGSNRIRSGLGMTTNNIVAGVGVKISRFEGLEKQGTVLKADGLVKRTISLRVGEETCHLISYLLEEDMDFDQPTTTTITSAGNDNNVSPTTNQGTRYNTATGSNYYRQFTPSKLPFFSSLKDLKVFATIIPLRTPYNAITPYHPMLTNSENFHHQAGSMVNLSSSSSSSSPSNISTPPLTASTTGITLNRSSSSLPPNYQSNGLYPLTNTNDRSAHPTSLPKSAGLNATSSLTTNIFNGGSRPILPADGRIAANGQEIRLSMVGGSTGSIAVVTQRALRPKRKLPIPRITIPNIENIPPAARLKNIPIEHQMGQPAIMTGKLPLVILRTSRNQPNGIPPPITPLTMTQLQGKFTLLPPPLSFTNVNSNSTDGGSTPNNNGNDDNDNSEKGTRRKSSRIQFKNVAGTAGPMDISSLLSAAAEEIRSLSSHSGKDAKVSDDDNKKGEFGVSGNGGSSFSSNAGPSFSSNVGPSFNNPCGSSLNSSISASASPTPTSTPIPTPPIINPRLTDEEMAEGGAHSLWQHFVQTVNATHSIH